MQMKALRSANFAKLSSSSATSEVYWVASMSAGTPAGYWLSQTRSMVFPLSVTFTRLSVGVFWRVLSHASGHGKRANVAGGAGEEGLPRRSAGLMPSTGRLAIAGRALRSGLAV